MEYRILEHWDRDGSRVFTPQRKGWLLWVNFVEDDMNCPNGSCYTVTFNTYHKASDYLFNQRRSKQDVVVHAWPKVDKFGWPDTAKPAPTMPECHPPKEE